MNTTMTTRRRQPLRSLFDDMFQDFFVPAESRAERGALLPMNVSEIAEAFQLAFELPGVQEDEIQVQADGNQLSISAERKFTKVEGTDYHRVEHRYGSFARSVSLPRDVRMDDVTATFKNGVLTVTVPKVEPSESKKIEIRTG